MDAETFALWLDSPEFVVGLRVQRWWTGMPLAMEGEVGALKSDDDETVEDLFARVLVDVRADSAERGAGAAQDASAPVGTVHVRELVAWLRQCAGEDVLHGVSVSALASVCRHCSLATLPEPRLCSARDRR